MMPNTIMDHEIKILIAEDSPDYAFFLQRVLEHSGLPNSTILGDGLQVVEYLTAQGKFFDRAIFPLPDILLTDLKMPRMNGFDLLRWLQQHPQSRPAGPVIVLSSSADEYDAALAYHLGANAFLTKPGGLAELQQMLHAIVHFWTAHSQPLTSNRV